MTNEIKGGDTLELSSDINVITAEINAYQRVAGEAIFEIGRRLKHVKENDLAHGEWTSWCEKEIGMTIMQANKFIKVFEEVGEGANLKSTLGIEALYQIATLPPEQREAEHVTEKGETKKPEDMTVRELRELKKALKASEQAKEQAERQADIERSQRERLEEENEQLAEKADKPPEVRTEYIEVKDEIAERKLQRYEELFGDVSMYEGKTTRVTNGDAITYTVFEFSEDVRKFIEKYGHLTHFAREFNEMIGEGKDEYRKAIGDMVRFMGAIERNLNEEETIIING